MPLGAKSADRRSQCQSSRASRTEGACFGSRESAKAHPAIVAEYHLRSHPEEEDGLIGTDLAQAHDDLATGL